MRSKKEPIWGLWDNQTPHTKSPINLPVRRVPPRLLVLKLLVPGAAVSGAQSSTPQHPTHKHTHNPFSLTTFIQEGGTKGHGAGKTVQTWKKCPPGCILRSCQCCCSSSSYPRWMAEQPPQRPPLTWVSDGRASRPTCRSMARYVLHVIRTRRGRFDQAFVCMRAPRLTMPFTHTDLRHAGRPGGSLCPICADRRLRPRLSERVVFGPAHAFQ